MKPDTKEKLEQILAPTGIYTAYALFQSMKESKVLVAMVVVAACCIGGFFWYINQLP